MKELTELQKTHLTDELYWIGQMCKDVTRYASGAKKVCSKAHPLKDEAAQHLGFVLGGVADLSHHVSLMMRLCQKHGIWNDDMEDRLTRIADELLETVRNGKDVSP